jgi:signal transduction histidine kinase
MLSKIYQNNEVLYKKSLSILREGATYATIAPVVYNRYLSSFVEVYSLLGEIDSALHYENLLENATKSSATVPSEMVSANLNIAKFYIAQNQTDKAFPYINKADKLATESKSPILIYQAQLWMGRYLEKMHRFNEAVTALAQSLPVAKQINKEQFVEGLNYMAIAQSGAGNLKAAIDYYEQFVAQSDSLTNEKISRDFADQEIRYETGKKESRIVSLDKENRLNMLELQSASHLRVLLILALMAVGTITLLLYFIYRNKEKANTVLNKQNDQLEILNKQLALANETKAKLFGIIGHDLRSPISQIVQLLQLQKENPGLLTADAKQRHENKLSIASENVLETMEDLLLWSKSQMQHFAPNLMPVNVSAILQKELDMLQQRIDDKNMTVSNSVPPKFIQQTDENFLAVIIRNLLQNAVKYTVEKSTITISADGQKLYIANQSPKATAEMLNAFLHSKQVDSKTSGLGLQIASDLATSMQANIFFEQKDEQTLVAILGWMN